MTTHQPFEKTRREFFNSTASGLGAVALGAALTSDGLLSDATAAAGDTSANPMLPRPSHQPARAKACIFIFMAGAPSHIDLFDPKPVLNERHGQSLPKDVLDSA